MQLGTDRFFETTQRTFTLSGCGICRSLFIDPLPNRKDLAHFYPSEYWWRSSNGLLKLMENAYRRVILRDHLAAIMGATASLSAHRTIRVLDVGCGSGTVLGLLKRRGFDVTGFDSSRDAATIAKTEGDVDVVVGSRIHDAAFTDDAFDLVTLFHVMEHVPDPREILAEVRRVLQPNGRILVQVPNVDSWQSKLCGAQWYGLDVPRHVINYSNKSIRRLILDCGFRIFRTRHFNMRDNAPALASSLLPSLDPISRRARQHRTGRRESSTAAWVKHVAYAALVAGMYPFTVAEALFGAGGTVMVEAGQV
jgi:2-polyprenyl-3-methyl-5-hydroxy-6-metoxy-1,4-benzoquinol methylase